MPASFRRARFAQPIGTLILYPMLGLSGLFVPIESLPPALQALARLLPLTYVVSLLRGIWRGDGWGEQHTGDLAALALLFIICTVVSAESVSLGIAPGPYSFFDSIPGRAALP